MTEDGSRTEYDAAFQAGENSALGKLVTSREGAGHYLVKEGYRLVAVDKDIDGPVRKSGLYEVHSIGSFMDLVDRWRLEKTIIFFDAENLEVTSVIDDHSSDNTGWSSHKVVYRCPLSDQISEWFKVHDTWLTQRQFAELLTDRREDLCPIPNGPSEDFASLIMQLKGTQKVDWKNVESLVNSDKDHVHTRRLRITAGTEEIELPEEFVINVEFFKGGDLYKIPCRLLHDLCDGMMGFKVKIRDKELLVTRLFGDMIGEFQDLAKDWQDPPLMIEGKPQI